VQVRLARGSELVAVAEVWYRGLGQEEGSPWADYRKRWTPGSAAKWFLDYTKRLGGRFLVAEKSGKIVGMNGIIFEKKSGVARFFTGVVVAPEERRQGIGSLLLYRSLLEAKREGLRNAEVETIQGITATRHLYPKFGGTEKIVAS
jgi:GNAT superfamily N-acetyltransferase